MKVLNKSHLIYSDSDYTSSVNYRHLYNAPVTLNINNFKYILGCGNSDFIRLYQYRDFIYVLSYNMSLNYISLEVINMSEGAEVGSIFLDSNELDSLEINIFELSNEEQINYLLEYIN